MADVLLSVQDSFLGHTANLVLLSDFGLFVDSVQQNQYCGVVPIPTNTPVDHIFKIQSLERLFKLQESDRLYKVVY